MISAHAAGNSRYMSAGLSGESVSAPTAFHRGRHPARWAVGDVAKPRSVARHPVDPRGSVTYKRPVNAAEPPRQDGSAMSPTGEVLTKWWFSSDSSAAQRRGNGARQSRKLTGSHTAYTCMDVHRGNVPRSSPGRTRNKAARSAEGPKAMQSRRRRQAVMTSAHRVTIPSAIIAHEVDVAGEVKPAKPGGILMAARPGGRKSIVRRRLAVADQYRLVSPTRSVRTGSDRR